MRVKLTCWSVMDKLEDERFNLHMHQRLGSKSCLSFNANNFKPSLCNQLAGNLWKSIQGSANRKKSGLCFKTNLLRANLVGELAQPRRFQKRPFIWRIFGFQSLIWLDSFFWFQVIASSSFHSFLMVKRGKILIIVFEST